MNASHPRKHKNDAAIAPASVRRTANGKFIINGKHQSELVGKHQGVKIQKCEIKPKHFSEEFIADLVRAMKVS